MPLQLLADLAERHRLGKAGSLPSDSRLTLTKPLPDQHGMADTGPAI